MANAQYSDRVIAGMQMLFGAGFLSPGGAEEVAQMAEGESFAGKTVLDFGCGIGGGALMLAGELGAARVIALDVEPESLARTREAAAARGLDERIETLHSDGGRLPLDDGAVDMVFTKDVVCHIADKAAAFAEMARVLKPGGRLVCADFLKNTEPGLDAANAQLFDDWVETLRTYGLHFHYEGPAVYERALAAAGFRDVGIHDHTADSAAFARREHGFVTGPDAGPVEDALGEDYFQVRIRLSEQRAMALERRGLIHLHIRATRP